MFMIRYFIRQQKQFFHANKKIQRDLLLTTIIINDSFNI
jgi:hypothetical protein